MYPLLVFLHVIGVFGFLMAHGVSAGVAFRLRSERTPDKVRALLELSGASYPVMYRCLLLLLILGIVLGFMGSWWGRAWIWVSLILIVALVMAMGRLGGAVYSQARKLAGLPYAVFGKPYPAVEPASPAELHAVLAQGNPMLLTVIGFGGIAVIAWLMMFKPF